MDQAVQLLEERLGVGPAISNAGATTEKHKIAHLRYLLRDSEDMGDWRWMTIGFVAGALDMLGRLSRDDRTRIHQLAER